MARRSGRIAALLAVAVLLSAKTCHYAVEEANEIDRERIEIMRTDPIYTQVTDERVWEGSLRRYPGGHSSAANSYRGYLDPWLGQPPPEQPTVALAAEQVTTILTDLTTNGWTITGANCHLSIPRDFGASPPMRYQWSATGYQIRDGIPYGFNMKAEFLDPDLYGDDPERERELGLSVEMITPYHADPDSYLDPPPDPDPRPDLHPTRRTSRPRQVPANQGKHRGRHDRALLLPRPRSRRSTGHRIFR